MAPKQSSSKLVPSSVESCEEDAGVGLEARERGRAISLITEKLTIVDPPQLKEVFVLKDPGSSAVGVDPGEDPNVCWIAQAVHGQGK